MLIPTVVLEQSARSCHYRTFRSSLPVPA